MIRRITRRNRRRSPEPLKGVALERRVDLWPFLLAALLAAAAVTAVEPRIDEALEAHVFAERQPAAGPQLSERVQAESR